MTRMTQPHVDPPPIPLIKENHDGMSDKDSFEIKLRRDPTSSMPYHFELKVSLFDNDKPELLLLFVRNFNMTLAESEMLKADVKFQYGCTLLRGKVLRQFDSLSSDVEITETLNMDYIIRFLARYFSPANYLSKQKRAMRRGNQKTTQSNCKTLFGAFY